MMQIKQNEWTDQWSNFIDDELFLFTDWIHPVKIDDFKDQNVLECGCGGGQHTGFIAPYAREIVSVDLNTIEIAKERNKRFNNIRYVDGDISKIDLEQTFDIVFSIGVVHHSDNPDQTVKNLIRHVKKGGRIILWVYSREGNFLVEKILEPFRKRFLKNLKRSHVINFSRLITWVLYIPVYTIYLLPFKNLPYYEYFINFRKLSFNRNMLNVFDKLNAPQVEFIAKERVEQWLTPDQFDDIHIEAYKGVSWRASGKRK